MGYILSLRGNKKEYISLKKQKQEDWLRWIKALDLKSKGGFGRPWVRIPHPLPLILTKREYMDYKLFKKAFSKWRDWRLRIFIGFNPPWIINGERKFNPSLREIYQEEKRQQESRLREKRIRSLLIQRGWGTKIEKRVAMITLAVETDEGRLTLAENLAEVMKEHLLEELPEW